MKSYGVDSRESWRIAILCGVLYLMATQSLRVVGIIFVGLLEDFGVNREEGSWPLTIHGMVIQMAAPLVSLLCHYFSHDTVLRVSSIISALAISSCYFCPSVMWITILFGVVHGGALSAIFVTVSVIQAEHFDKKRSSAIGLSATIASLSMFFIPQIFDKLVKEFRLKGSLLILGALTLHAFAFSLAVSMPVKLKKRSLIPDKVAKQIIEESCFTTKEPPAETSEVDGSRRRTSSLHSVVDDFSGSVQCGQLPDVAEPIPEIVLSDPEGRKSVVSVDKAPVVPQNIFGKLRVLMSFTFFADATSFAIIFTGLTTFLLLAVDFVQDRGIHSSNAIHTFSAFCAGDLLLRATSGVFIDTNIIPLTAVMAIGFWLQAVGYVMFVWLRSFTGILLASFVIGASNGSRIFLLPVVFIKDFGLSQLTNALGLGSLINGFISLCRPPMIGYFRDNMGDYTGLFLVLVVCNIIFGSYWTIRWAVQDARFCRKTPSP